MIDFIHSEAQAKEELFFQRQRHRMQGPISPTPKPPRYLLWEVVGSSLLAVSVIAIVRGVM